MIKRRSSPEKVGKKFHIELTFFSSFLWGVFLLFLLAWVFVLGIFVGRGFLPGNVAVLADMKTKMGQLYHMASRDRSADINAAGKQYDIDQKLAFYDNLSSKKEEVKKNWGPEGKDGNHNPAAFPNTTGASPGGPAGGKEIPGVKVSGQRPEPTPDGMQYTLQLVSLSDGIKAQKMIQELTERGYPAYSYVVRVKDKTYYRVRCGRFLSREDAEKYADKMKKEGGITGFVSKLE